jgi:hypothetical protein
MAAAPYELSSSLEAPRRRLDLSKLRVAAYGGGFGLLVVAAGLLLIGLGWNGMAGAGGEVNGVPNLNAQLPWLVSGGILGLALVFFGASMLIVHNARTDRARLEAKLDELVGVLGRPAELPAQLAAGRAVVYAGPSAYHVADCRLIQGRAGDLATMSRGTAADSGLKPCRVCKPA